MIYQPISFNSVRALLLGLSLFLSMATLANSNWICTEASSLRNQNIILSCGIGIGLTEADARQQAFERAHQEFQQICDSSDDCRDHQVNVAPKRTTCEAIGNENKAYKCYRALEFHIAGERSSTSELKPVHLFGLPFTSRDLSKAQTLGCHELGQALVNGQLGVKKEFRYRVKNQTDEVGTVPGEHLIEALHEHFTIHPIGCL